MATERRWLNPSQPQTLQIAVILLYMNAVFALIFGGLRSLLFLPFLAITVGEVAGGYGIANERKWGYVLGVIVAIAPLAILAFGVVHYGLSTVLATSFINLMFEIALVALLLHPHSREYQRIWFK